MTVATEDMLFTASSVELAAGTEKRPTISMIAYSGGLMRVPGWGDVAIDLEGLDAEGQIALLADHDSRVSGVVGHGNAQVRDGRLLVEGVLSGAGDAAKQIVVMTRGGFQFQASVGLTPTEHARVRPGEAVEVNGRSLSTAGGFTLVRKGKLREVSITPLGADAGTSVAIAAARKEGIAMNTEVQVDEQAIRADERDRLQQIENICRAPSGNWGASQQKVDELKAQAIAGEIEVADLSAQVLNILRESRPTMSGVRRPTSVGGVTTLEAALLNRMGLAELGEKSLGALAMEHGESLRATHALDLCRAALRLDGVDEPHGREEMVKAALSTTSLPVALGNVANKVLLDAYTESPATWRAFSAIRSAGDFKDQTAIRPSFTGSLEQVAPGGELKHGSVSEWTATYKIDTFGKVLSIDRRDLVNDDLGVFDDTARAFGRAAMRRLNDLVYEVLLANAGGFFSAGNGNLLEGVDTALGIDALAQAITAMLTQRDAEGNDLDLRPRTLLVAPELQTTAKAILESEFIQQIAEKQPTGNSLRRAVSIEVEPRLNNAAKYGAAASDKHWYLFSAPSNAAMVVAFLQGKQSPTVEFFGLDQDVNRLAASWRVYHD
ncbi:MAG: Mu-like prophage major head subunit gpT family protein, partial [Planctomycetota bacterium]|nr:Mu-like prophage major head subunit gpT family protein [Planctomycetota bacterium]